MKAWGKREFEQMFPVWQAGRRARQDQQRHVFQQGTRVNGQVVNIRIFERPDRWDGRTDWNFVIKAYVRAIDQQLVNEREQEQVWSVCSSTSSLSCCTSKDRRFKENAFTIDEKELEGMRIVGAVDAELNMMENRSVQVTAIREDGKIHCVLTQETEQIIWKLWTSGPCRSISFGGALWITRRRSQLESEPCEAVRNNPSGQHVPTMWRTERDARQGRELPAAGGQTFDRCWCVEGEHAISRRVQSSDGRIRKRNGSRRVHSLKLLRVVMDVFDSTSESCLDPKLREQRGDQAAVVSIEMSQGRDRAIGSDNARNVTNSNGLIDAKVIFFETMVKLGTSGSSTWMQPRTSMTTGDHHWVGTMIEMAIELLSEKQVRSDFKIGELYRKIMHGWEKERKDAPILESGEQSQVIVYCREREGCGFVYEDDFIFGENWCPPHGWTLRRTTRRWFSWRIQMATTERLQSWVDWRCRSRLRSEWIRDKSWSRKLIETVQAQCHLQTQQRMRKRNLTRRL